jgi:hypothetical protein
VRSSVIRLGQRLLAAGGALLLAGATGCGGSHASTASAPSATVTGTTTATTPAQPVQDVKGDRALGAVALLRLRDLPAGWTARPKSRSSAGPGLESGLAACLHASAAALASGPTKVSSPDFSDSHGSSISNGATYEATAARAMAWFRGRVQPRTPACLGAAVRAFVDYAIHHAGKPTVKIPAGLTFGRATVTGLSFPRYGDQSVAYRAVIPVSYMGVNVSIYLDFMVVRKGRAHTALSFQATATPVDRTLEERLTRLTLRRLRHTS